jgi:UDP-GlcNAc:undecaprenyl-phosphate GlcNAc-1-phosphate transferase
MGDSGSMLIGLVLAAGPISVTGQVDPDTLKLFEGGTRSATHAALPVFIPLLLPLTIIAIPLADLLLAVVRRAWNGQSPFAADRGHLHHRLLDIGHSKTRAVLIMYFWSALIAFGVVLYSVMYSTQGSNWVLPVLVGLSAVGLVLLLLPRFRPRAPRWAQSFVPPRYRRRSTRYGNAAADGDGSDAGAAEPVEGAAAGVAFADGGADGEPAAVPAGVNGATALGARSRFTDRGKAGSTR